MNLFSDIVTPIGFSAMIGGFIYVGRKLQVLDDLKSTIDKMKTNIKVIGDFLTRNHSSFNSSELQSYSPLKLTYEGDRLVVETKFDNVFRDHKEDFFSYISNEQPKLKYDVQAASIKSIYALYDKDYMSFLKIYLYNNPDRSMANVAPTFGVYVRDQYLREHSEIM
jgi:hypothetical protein